MYFDNVQMNLYYKIVWKTGCIFSLPLEKFHEIPY